MTRRRWCSGTDEQATPSRRLRSLVVGSLEPSTALPRWWPRASDTIVECGLLCLLTCGQSLERSGGQHEPAGRSRVSHGGRTCVVSFEPTAGRAGRDRANDRCPPSFRANKSNQTLRHVSVAKSVCVVTAVKRFAVYRRRWPSWQVLLHQLYIPPRYTRSGRQIS